MSDEEAMEIKDFNKVKKNQDKLSKYVTEQNHSTFIQKIAETTLIEDYPVATFTWRDLFIKLCFEQMLTYFP
jgi:hypothetical protein